MVPTTGICYRKGLKYQLTKESIIQLPFAPAKDIHTEYVSFFSNGMIVNKIGYAWDGASGPAINDKTNMLPSLVHDSGYQLLRLGLLSQDYRQRFDEVYRQLCIEHGMSEIRADLEYDAIRIFGAQFASVQKEQIIFAP